MKYLQKVALSEYADSYLRQFGSLSYVATRLLYELKDDVAGLPNLRSENRAACKTNNLTIHISEQLYSDLLIELQNQSDMIKASPNYVYFSFSRLLEWAASTEYPTQHNWPVLTDNPRLEFVIAQMYTLSNKDLTLLQTELARLKDTFVGGIIK